LADVRTFFQTYYRASNAVLVIIGDVEPSEAFALAEKYFAPIESEPAAKLADSSEPPQTEERRGTVDEKFATLPAVSIGYRAPARHTPDWYTMILLDQVLHSGRAGRMYRRLVLEQQLAIEADGSSGDFFELNGPMQLATRIIYRPDVSEEKILEAYDTIIQEARSKTMEASELEEVKVKLRSDYYSALEGGHGVGFPRFGLMHYLACFTLFDNDPALVNTILNKFDPITPAQIQDVAKRYLVPEQRAIVFRLPVQKTEPVGAMAGAA
jgi:zinc protease